MTNKIRIVRGHGTKRCPNCGCDTYLGPLESGRCPHCGIYVE